MSYCSIAEVEALLGFDLSDSPATVPTQTQATAFIADIAAELNVEMAAQGMTVPITTPANALLLVTLYNKWGAAAMAEDAMYTQQSPNESKRSKQWWSKYNAGLKRIRSEPGYLTNALLDTIQYDFATDAEIVDPISDDMEY